MMSNVAIDTLIGSIPLVGDLFDFAYKSNLKNLPIYEGLADAWRVSSASSAQSSAVPAGACNNHGRQTSDRRSSPILDHPSIAGIFRTGSAPRFSGTQPAVLA
jgi:hypothetical protein